METVDIKDFGRFGKNYWGVIERVVNLVPSTLSPGNEVEGVVSLKDF